MRAQALWRERCGPLLRGAEIIVLGSPRDIDARGDMLLGAYYAGAAIERSMLGATHACANPLTARYNIPHGLALALAAALIAKGARISAPRSAAACARSRSSASTPFDASITW